jgi:uncharacterized protein YpmB
MRKAIRIIVMINLVSFVVAAVGAYAFVNQKVEENYRSAYEQCLEAVGTVEDASQVTNAEAKSCYQQKGCYAYICGIKGREPAPSITMAEFAVLAKQAFTKTLPTEQECKNYCLPPPQ